jgi:hypothetical protein
MSSTTVDPRHVSAASAQTFPRAYTRISWGAILSGTAVALATSLLLGLIGLAIGASVLHVSHNAAGVAVGAQGSAEWVVLSTLLSMALGGYVAGRLAGTFSHLDSELHGLTVWALTALLSAALLAYLVGAELSLMNEGIGTAAGGAMPSTAATPGISQAEPATAPSPSGLASQLEQSLNTGGDPAHMTPAQITEEIGLLVNRRLVNGSLTPAERDRLIGLVKQRDDLTTDEASLRVARMDQDANAIAFRARGLTENADEAARVGARAVSASLLLGLAATLVGAWFGTRHVRQIVGQHAADVYGTEAEMVHRAPVAYMPPSARSATVMDFSKLTFPASRAELLRQAKTAGGDPSILAAMEAVTDRRYLSMEDLMTELHMSPV